jgi:hypothetical protein
MSLGFMFSLSSGRAGLLTVLFSVTCHVAAIRAFQVFQFGALWRDCCPFVTTDTALHKAGEPIRFFGVRRHGYLTFAKP